MVLPGRREAASPVRAPGEINGWDPRGRPVVTTKKKRRCLVAGGDWEKVEKGGGCCCFC